MNDLLVADFSNARVGDRVKCLIYGDGVIDSTTYNACGFPLHVKFANRNGWSASYTIDGKQKQGSNNTLFYHFEEQFPTAQACKRPLPEIALDEKVLVWSTPAGRWREMYATGEFCKRGIYVFCNGATSWSGSKTDVYVHWKLFKDETINSGNLDEIE